MTLSFPSRNDRKFQPSILRRLRRFVLVGSILGLCGCYQVSAVIPDTVPSETHTHWVNGFLWGALGGEINAGYVCGGRPVVRVATKRSGLNYLVHLVTMGIYTPSHVEVTCGQTRYAQPSYPPIYPGYSPPVYPYVPPAIPSY